VRDKGSEIATGIPCDRRQSAQALIPGNSATPSGATTRAFRATLRPEPCTTATLNALPATTSPNANNMEIRVAYEHSLASAPEEFIVHVPSQLVTDIPANVPRALLPEFIAELIIERSPTIGKIRNLRIL
jgi:hypothetical protein